ncbi:TetR/AcrR family transcriptional regulator [Paraburkholderia pallida]|uniref:TetR/AcrR family transcriptional regulator n=1 Tax=Paraburkholderia pallida TaxID=2547399 RepID=A0A4P7D4D3_9BURK|nr:TetR/AcrR family transcriptional regulator [Paraburkholderia pallida]QBR01585.1 TetR/AcrR family transcriptional regulator [Paraburkholderia pallida]
MMSADEQTRQSGVLSACHSSDQMPPRTALKKERPRSGRPDDRLRAEQQRAQETRASILSAAIAEFAAKGFEAASIRNIADRAGMQHPRITYHFRSKEILWQAAAEFVFEQIQHEWEKCLKDTPPACTLERLRIVYRTIFQFTIEHPECHRFLLQESLGYSPRLQLFADTVLKPLIGWLLPQIREAQDEGALPKVEPIMFHYLLISLTATLSSFGTEMLTTANISASDPNVAEAHWRTVETLIFNRQEP